MLTTANLLGAILVLYREIAGTSLLILSLLAAALLTFGRPLAQRFFLAGLIGISFVGVCAAGSAILLVQLVDAKAVDSAALHGIGAVVAALVAAALWFTCRGLERWVDPALHQAVWAGLLVPMAISLIVSSHVAEGYRFSSLMAPLIEAGIPPDVRSPASFGLLVSSGMAVGQRIVLAVALFAMLQIVRLDAGSQAPAAVSAVGVDRTLKWLGGLTWRSARYVLPTLLLAWLMSELVSPPSNNLMNAFLHQLLGDRGFGLPRLVPLLRSEGNNSVPMAIQLGGALAKAGALVVILLTVVIAQAARLSSRMADQRSVLAVIGFAAVAGQIALETPTAVAELLRVIEAVTVGNGWSDDLGATLVLDKSYVLLDPGYTLAAVAVFALAFALRQKESPTRQLTIGGILAGVLAAFGLLFRFSDLVGLATAIQPTREFFRVRSDAVMRPLPHDPAVILQAGVPALAGVTVAFCLFVIVRHVMMFRVGVQIFDLRSVALGLLAGLLLVAGVTGSIDTYVQNEMVWLVGQRDAGQSSWITFRVLRESLWPILASSQSAFAAGLLFAGVALVAASHPPGLRFGERRGLLELMRAAKRRVRLLWINRTLGDAARLASHDVPRDR